MSRYCYKYIAKDLKKKMVFIGGPRQVGKTTLSKALLKEEYYKNGEYFNWDVFEDRKAILNKTWRKNAPLVVFDELHKYRQWKPWIKGVYDIRPPHQEYMVTGSARLDVYRRGGDSLMGRYHHWRLHPFTLNELPHGMSSETAYERLLSVGGFPEPFLSGDEREARRWQRERFDRILREDVRDLENIRELQLLPLFVDALRNRVSGTVVLSNIAKDLELSPKTAKKWLSLVEKMYIAFSLYPLTKNIPRAIQKPPKVYFYDNADVMSDHGSRLENLVATHLLKNLQFIEDYHGYRCELHYIRDKEGREVDFVTIIDGKIMDLIEVKSSDTDISSALKYYAKLLKPNRAIQLVGNLKRSFDKDNISVMHPIEFFKIGPWDEK
ncbi:MAG TPA: ATP-binding protein [Gammaproteobacteria bacterium]|nr:ATP-binding protein [Gammaproteobacteria bacterium]